MKDSSGQERHGSPGAGPGGQQKWLRDWNISLSREG